MSRVGALSIALPISLYGTLIRFVGVLLFGSGAVKADQLLIGRRSATERVRAWPVIVLPGRARRADGNAAP